MGLNMHLVLEINVAPRMKACNRLPGWMMAEVLPIEVQFQVAMTGERPQTSRRRQLSIA